MKIHVLALDYDGTIASDGVLHEDVREAIVEARSVDIVVVLVTGRIHADLRRVLDEPWIFDGVVAENGAVVHFPSEERSILLAQAPAPLFLDELRRRQVPFLAGECLVEFDAEHAITALAAIRDLELPLVLLFNRGRVMALPQAISKATGLREILRALRLSPHNALAIGDAENDHELLNACEFGVAVGWGSEALKRVADEVLEGEGPNAVAKYIREIIEEPRIAPARIGKRRIHLGIRDGGEPLTLAIRGRNVLVAGDTQSGKSWVAGLLCEQLVLQHYCVFVVDPEGEYAGIEALPSVVVLDSDPAPPQIEDVERTLRYPDVSVVLDLSTMEHEAKCAYAKELLKRLERLRRRTGLPHRIVLDEAHYFLDDPDAAELFDSELAGYLLVTYRASQLNPGVLEHTDAVIVTRVSDAMEATALRRRFGADTDPQDWTEVLRSLSIHQAVLLPGADESGPDLVRFRVSPRLTRHVRHRNKYLQVPVAPGQAFVFTRGGEPTGQSARTLGELIAVLSHEEPYREHLAGHDFSRWIRHLFADQALADRLREIEVAWGEDRIENPHDLVIAAVRQRYAGHEGAL